MSFVFLALSEHPKVKQFSRTDPDQYFPIMLDYVSSFERLILKDCNKEAKDAIRFEGINSLGAASSKIGQIGIRELMQSPEVAKVYDHMQKLSDEGEWDKLLK